MALPESQSINYGGDKTEMLPQPPQLQAQKPPKVESQKDYSIPQVNQPHSVFSLTLNEIQLKRGKSIGSMNMDEFLANLWSADDQNNQVLAQTNSQNEPTKHNDNNTNAVNQTTPLKRQGSFSLPTPLCKKTVDEVWFEIQNEGQPQGQKPKSIGAASYHHGPPQPQQTLGEITLEDFLVKAGIVQEAPGSLQSKIATAAGSMQNNANQCLDATNYRIEHVVALPGGLSGRQNVGASAGNGFTLYQMFPQSSAKNDKGHGSMAEMAVERRQRRMIKNRESAARSRARKQAYTVELELELNQLKEENAKLKAILEEIEQKRKEEVLKRKPLTMPPKKADKLRTIRRTTSLAW